MNEGQQVSYQGHEVALYPLNYVNITAGPWASNHTVVGVSNSGCWDNGWYQTYYRPLYAPFSMTCYYSAGSAGSLGHGQLWVSDDEVWLPGYSEPQYASFMVLHSNTQYYGVGDSISQGTHFFDTGDYGLGTGPHVHMILMVGRRTSVFPAGRNPTYGNIWYSPNAPGSIADYFYLTGEPAVGSGGYGGQNFKTWHEQPEPPGPSGNTALLAAMLERRKRKWKHIVMTS